MNGNYVDFGIFGATGLLLMVTGIALLSIAAIEKVDHDSRRFQSRLSLGGDCKISKNELKAQKDFFCSGLFAFHFGMMMLLVVNSI